MSGAGVVDLGSVAEIVMGTSPRGSSYNYDGVGHPLLNGPTEFGPRHPTPVLYTTEATRFAEVGDLLFCVRGSTTGRMNWADRKYAIGRGVAAVRGSTMAETVFLRAAIELALPAVLAGATGSTMPNLNADAMRRIPVPVNSASDLVGSVIAVFDDLTENNRRRIELLEQMAQAIYREWFVHFRYPGHEDNELVDSDLGPIPEGWEVSNLFDAADVGFGFSFKSKQFSEDGPFPVIRIRDVPNGTTRTFTSEEAPERYRVADGDVLVGMDGEFYVRQWTGGDAWLNQRVARLRPIAGMSARHLMLAIAGPIRAWNESISGTTVAHLGKRHLEQVQVVIPDSRILARATSLLDDIARQECTLAQSARRLAATRDLLLPKLVTGEIDVSQLDLDAQVEAASA